MVDDDGDVWTVVNRGTSRLRASHGRRREVSGPRYISEHSFGECEYHESEIAPAMCVVERNPMDYCLVEKSVRFDPDDFIGKRSVLGPAKGASLPTLHRRITAVAWQQELPLGRRHLI